MVVNHTLSWRPRGVRRLAIDYTHGACRTTGDSAMAPQRVLTVGGGWWTGNYARSRRSLIGVSCLDCPPAPRPCLSASSESGGGTMTPPFPFLFLAATYECVRTAHWDGAVRPTCSVSTSNAGPLAIQAREGVDVTAWRASGVSTTRTMYRLYLAAMYHGFCQPRRRLRRWMPHAFHAHRSNIYTPVRQRRLIVSSKPRRSTTSLAPARPLACLPVCRQVRYTGGMLFQKMQVGDDEHAAETFLRRGQGKANHTLGRPRRLQPAGRWSCSAWPGGRRLLFLTSSTS